MNKPISFFLSLLFSSALFVLGGCDGDPEPETSLLFASGNNLITQNQTVAGGQVLTTSVYAQTGSGNQLKSFKITRVYDGKDSIVYLDSALNAKEFGLYFTFATRAQVGKETWIYTAKDEKDVASSRKYTITTTSGNTATQPFYSYSSYYYHRSAVENLQYFALADGTIYPGYAVRNNPAIKSKVDFYFNQDAAKTVSLHAVAPANTEFKTTNLTNTDYSGIRTLEALKAVFTNSSAAPVDVLPNLRKNQFIAFKTEDKSGVIRIVAVEKRLDATKMDSVLVRMNFEVKTEK